VIVALSIFTLTAIAACLIMLFTGLAKRSVGVPARRWFAASITFGVIGVILALISLAHAIAKAML